MKHLINAHVKDIEISGIRKFFNMVADKEDVVSLTIGQPDFPTPEHVKEAGKKAIDQNKTTYTHNAGLLSLREAIANFVQDEYNVSYQPEDEIIVTVGASEAIDITFRTILSPGDEVLLPAPVYPGYEPLIRLAGAKPVHVNTANNGFKWSVDLLKKHITPKTKCIVFPYPSNPTGATLSKVEVEQLVTFLKDQDIFLLCDEIYSQLTYGEAHTSIASYPEMKEKTIVINGVSKSHSMTGWRIGYLLAPSWLAQQILKVHQYNVSCPTSISQHAALAAIQNGKQDTEIMRQQYEERMQYVYDRLLNMGIQVEKPGGAFYLFPSFPTGNHTSFDVALDLVDKVGLAVVPGDAFSKYGQGYLRISYAYNLATLKEGMNRLESYVNQSK
ncbi:aminotransferase A [Pontibacillus litoralis]|uniref:Aminotransferase n=1 Tax=Pontibacillus litoralis JSM 072002 TaxID=1385512 RepID=A0A0A5G1B8_9BACI|nr:aminotransferase A [Pontibacillus litoralis]KGX86896.1 aminotransferase A [Pontibacillus litoralis JSM 072002]